MPLPWMTAKASGGKKKKKDDMPKKMGKKKGPGKKGLGSKKK